MNREILFRGLRVDGNGWAFGSLVCANESTPNIFYGAVIQDGKITMSHTPVIPDTVGQYTGMKDKNGVKIFDGDICSFKSIGLYTVVFDDSGWILRWDNSHLSLNRYDSEAYVLVSGNIHEKKGGE